MFFLGFGLCLSVCLFLQPYLLNINNAGTVCMWGGVHYLDQNFIEHLLYNFTKYLRSSRPYAHLVYRNMYYINTKFLHKL